MQNDRAKAPADSIYSANLLYLAVMLLLVTLGVGFQLWQPVGGLLLTELVVILAPALIVVMLWKQSPLEALRLRWPGWRVAALGVVSGVGMWFVVVWLDGLMARLLGYTLPMPEGYLPDTPAKAVLLFVALAAAAPLCEEVLFRGVIQRAYEERAGRAAVIRVGMLFALFHLRFQGLLALIPVSLLLGYLVWRSQSLIPAVLAHVAINSIAAAMTILTAFRPDLVLDFFNGVGALVGAVVVTGAVWLLRRWTDAPSEPPSPAPPRGWFSRHWPLMIAVLIYVVFAGLELITGLFPEWFSSL